MDTHFMRHLLATIAYRATKVIENAPEHYPAFDAGQGVRTPVEILHHVWDVLLIAYRDLCGGERVEVPVADWGTEVERFYDVLSRLDEAVAGGAQPQKRSWEQILQGPLSDALTHIGQLATLRRLAGAPVPPESYLRARIQIGRIRPS
ncbi:MAG: hypothetical protein K6T81_19830 [Alicyclobacillus macrosporangiidus]|uniref:hypothetical protein n=1 Tax=Alicyclobacillus macrosporangiidus TaxID=392015 RepID=UPI0026ED578E|nr:hypothetical protein [Alicyclobacillus macrosporangiidus]MCL6600961.1 hypothetical protein [Alicyclobacillus macrosporangiidus]